MGHDVFLSYSTKDKLAADAACAVLERNGIRVWMAPRDILPSEEWAEAIIRAIGSARAMVLIFSGAAIEAKPVRTEVERAFNKGVPVIPFRIENVEPRGSMEFFLNASHWLDAFTQPMESHLGQLADVVQRVLEPKGEETPTPLLSQPSVPAPAPKSRRSSMAAGALIVVIAAGGGWWLLAPKPVPDAQQAAFDAAVQKATIPALDAFLAKYPSGALANSAKAAREKLRRSLTQEHASSCSGMALTPPASRAPTPLARLEVCALKAKDVFRECESCPEMVVIPAGTFLMGSSDESLAEHSGLDDEGPQHQVQISKPFAVGKLSVTVGQFKAFVKESGYSTGSSCWILNGGEMQESPGHSWRDPGFPQTDSHPAACLNWNDASAYAEWLSRKTGEPYRLLSEAEWEYAARGGTVTQYWWGASVPPNQVNYLENSTLGRNKKGKSWRGTVPADSFSPNLFGLYNIQGNLWQWVEDCYHKRYFEAPDDGSAWTTAACGKRVLRGGSWDSNAGSLRVAYRSAFSPDARLSYNGMRVARMLYP
jgi:formylglycine-generating enzyme required for sulfatase activity